MIILIAEKRKEILKMLDLIKAIYTAIINIFKGEVDESGEKQDIFAGIKKAFDDFFAKLG